MPELAEPTVTTPPEKGTFFNSPDFDKSLEDAIQTAGIAELPATPAPAPKPVEAPAPEKKDAPAPATIKDDDEIPPDIKSPGAQSSWKRLKESKARVEGERDSVKKERDAFKSEIETLKKSAATPAQKTALADDPEYQQLKKSYAEKEKELETYSERIRLLDVEQHPKFIAHYGGLLEAQMNIAKNIGGDKAVEILKLPNSAYRDEQLEALASELSPMKAAQLGSVLTRLDEIQADKSREIAKAKDSYAQIQTQEKQKSEQERTAIEKVFQQVRNDVLDKDKGLYVFHEREGDEEWNNGVKERLSLTEHALAGKLPPEDVAKAVYWAAAAPQFLMDNNSLRAKNAELEKSISELRALSPSPGGDKPGAGEAPVQEEPRGMEGYMSRIAAALPGR